MGVLLSKPKTDKELEKGDDGTYLAYGCAAMQGWRTGMEDAHALIPRLKGDDSLPPKAFFAVYDGHGGYEVAKFASRHVHKALESSDKFKNGQIGEALTEAYISTDDLLTTEEGQTELQVIHSVFGSSSALGRIEGAHVTSMLIGCTAVSCVVDFQNKIITCANSGDSRCVVSESGKAVRLSEDHKPQLPSEEKRILAAGGKICNGRVNNNLNLTRCIGDHEYKQNKSLSPAEQIITCVPDIRTHQIAETTDFILLGCDGVWDIMRDQEAVNFVLMRLLPRDCLTEEEKNLATVGNIQRDARWADYEDPSSDLSQWPGDHATSLDDLLVRTASQLVDKCLAPAVACGIGCDNMSACIVLMRDSAFGKRVITALNDRLAKMEEEPEEEEKPEGEEKPEEEKPEEEKTDEDKME